MEINNVGIRRVRNGYVMDFLTHERTCSTLDECFAELLLYFEGRAATFTGESYGHVYVDRDPQPRVAIPHADHDRVIRNQEYRPHGDDEEAETSSAV